MAREKRNQQLLDVEAQAESPKLGTQPIETENEMPTWDPKEGYADLKARMERGERAGAPGMDEIEEADLLAFEEEAAKPAGKEEKPRKIRWKLAVVLAAALVLTLILGVGTFGEKVYRPDAVTELKDGEVIIKIDNKEVIERDVEEAEIYQEIEERLGVLALRLGYKPVGMELHKVEILEDVGEAELEFIYKKQFFAVYVSRNYADAGVGVKSDGEQILVETAESFWLDQELDVTEVKYSDDSKVYLVEMRMGNAAYVVSGHIPYEEFLKIIQEIYLKNA